MDALTGRTIRRLCERLEAFRQKGPIPALMAEFRVGAPGEETRPLRGFEDAIWEGSLRQLPDGTRSSRSLWLAAEPALVEEFRNFSQDAGRVAVPALRAVGYQVGLGAPGLVVRWLWSVFEMAEFRLPGTILRLVGDTVWRVNAQGLPIGEGVSELPPPFCGLAATLGATRYWKLADAVEASLAVLDIAYLRLEAATPAAQHQTAAAAHPRGRRRSTRKIDVDGAMGKLEAKIRRELLAECGSESAADAALIDRLYALSAQAMVPMLKGVNCKASAKTVSRSNKYKSWRRHRRPSAAGAIPDPTRLNNRGIAKSAAVAQVAHAVDSGDLSLRVGGRGNNRPTKSAAEKALETAADQLALSAGVALPPAD